MGIVNVLIVDDNPVTSDCIQKRLEKANGIYSKGSAIQVKPFYRSFSVADLQNAGKLLEDFIFKNSIDFLLLDRGFVDVIDPDHASEDGLDSQYLFFAKGQGYVKIEEILRNVSFSKIKKMKGVIVYSFDTPCQTAEKYPEPAQIKRDIADIIGSGVNEENIEIFLTNTEVYSLAGIDIYKMAGREYNDKYLYLGNKSDFSLYGLFIGEILYHRIINILETRRKRAISTRQGYGKRSIVLLFIIFSALTIGGNALYDLIFQNIISNNVALFLISVVFSLFLPIILLILKPEWVVSIDDDMNMNI
uniref:Uncharacterized protein n=1 Tax=Candidatus Kentrum sp. LPFa TaxID=2126335 RepID=A0A450WHM3_9GAMM|nr:MAG: hypothetical protein BECKLPF1236B_GA0070989_109712 [Candidatus Kentron sp. LPFa]